MSMPRGAQVEHSTLSLVSPLMRFEFEIPSSTPPPSPFSPVLTEARPGTSHSTSGKAQPSGGDGKGRAADGEGAGLGLFDGLGWTSPGPTENMDDFARAVEMSLSRPTTSGSDARPQTAGSNNGTPQFHSSLFPHRASLESATGSSPVMPAMSRSFIDSRDKPYGPSPTPRLPMMLANNSSPNLVRPGSSGSGLRNPPSLQHARLSPKNSMQDQFPRTNYSGSTARPSTRASSGSPTVTIGTPYQATSSTFPLPQHVQTRPKNGNTEAMVAGVKVPTHHTSASPKPASKSAAKPVESKRKTRLLNPLALLQRRRSEHPTDNADEERAQRQAQEQALARQRDVVASGVNKPPPDFDPRIKGKVVHDFSAPRGKRNTFDEMDLPLPPHGVHSPASPALAASPMSPMSPMSANGFPPRTASLVNRGPRNQQAERPERRSTHTPVFVEHLSENPETERRVSSIHAENLENKDFLQRASKQSAVTSHSQESAVLPPFARRSQILDPLQASLYQDGESKRSSDPSTTDHNQDTSLSSLGDISPITARSSAQNFGAVSPFSNGKNSRPVSHISPAPSNEQAIQLSPPLSKTPSQEESRRPPSEVSTKSYPVMLAPPAIETINEGSVDSSPVQPSASLFPLREPRVDTQGISIQQSGQTSRPPSERTYSTETQSRLETTSETPTPARTPNSQSPGDSRKFVEKRASAVGHANRATSTPKKHASNASRFSFQLGESAAQEHALEEKHRKIVSSSGPAQTAPRAFSPDDDEDDYFDEDAMDDMDEMEMQSGHVSDDRPTVPQSSLYLHQARQALHVPESDDGSMYDEETPEVTDERDVPYADHPAFRAHPAMDHHFAHNSMLPGTSEDYPHDGYWRDSTLDSYMRDSYYSSQHSQHSRMQSRGSRTTVDTGSPLHQGANAPSFQDYLTANDGSLGVNRLSMPRSNLQVSATSSPTKHARPPLPARDSGNSERNRVASGMAFNSNAATPSSEKSQWVGDDVQSSDHHVRDMSFSTISEAHSSTVTNQDTLRRGGSGLDMQSAMASPNVASTPRPRKLNFDDIDQSQNQNQNHVTSPQLNRETLAGLESGNGKSEQQPLASPKSAKSFRSDGRRNGSVGGLSLASPKSVFSHKSAGSESFEAFAESSGLSRVGSPQVGRNALGALPLPNGNEQDQQEIARVEERGGDAHVTNGLGLNMFSGFDFDQPKPSATKTPDDHRTTDPNANMSDSNKGQQHKARFSLFPHQTNGGSRPDSRGTQKDAAHLHAAMLQSNRTTVSRYSGFSDVSQSTAVQGGMASYSPVRSSMAPSFQFPRANEAYDDSKDDMYFDDGNFEQDINAPQHAAFDENTFDDDAFLARPGMNIGHQRDISSGAFSATSLGSDGPYPTFAMPNAAKARQRESQMMLEDLVLQDSVDPKLIPQRNPSEDAKRLRMGDSAPPLGMESSTSKEEAMHMQRNLDNYHSALANAANKAAADGRFWRAPSTASGRSVVSKVDDGKSVSSWEDQNVYVNAGEGENNQSPDTNTDPNVLKSPARPSGLAFDFGFDESTRDDVNDYEYENDDDLVAAANAEALASDDEGFYGQEFAFYGRPRANSNEFNPTIGGYFGEDGDDGLNRNKSLREPNLTPITERSEFSTRNSVIGLGLGMGGQALHGPPSAGLYGAHSPALARMSVTPLMESEMSFDELRKLRGQAFGGSGKSLQSNSARSSAQSLEGSLVPGQSGRLPPSNTQQHTGAVTGTPFKYASSPDSNGSSNPSSAPAHVLGQAFQESPHSATSSQGNPFSMDLDLTPRKNSQPVLDPATARKNPRESALSQSDVQSSHSRKGSDTVTYTREPSTQNWVMERRRTSEQGQLQLIGRELVQGGWI